MVMPGCARTSSSARVARVLRPPARLAPVVCWLAVGAAQGGSRVALTRPAARGERVGR